MNNTKMEKLKEYYSSLENEDLQQIVNTKLYTLSDEEQKIIRIELVARGLMTENDEDKVNFNPNMLKEYLEKMRLEQNLFMGILAGFIAAIFSATLWAVITVITEYQIGYMAIAVGFIVGFSIRYFGKGIDQIFGIMGAILALFGCVLGNFLSVVGFLADSGDFMMYIEILSVFDFSMIIQILLETFNPIDILFYGFALYEGYRFSFRQFTDEEIIKNTSTY
ncbi:MAG: hypothetical protein ACPG4Z_06380 [Chitinophagales bacterium]